MMTDDEFCQQFVGKRVRIIAGLDPAMIGRVVTLLGYCLPNSDPPVWIFGESVTQCLFFEEFEVLDDQGDDL